MANKGWLRQVKQLLIPQVGIGLLIVVVTLVIGFGRSVSAAPPPQPDVTFALLAAGERTSVLAPTGSNVTTQHNGSGWYYNTSASMGFAPAGAPIQQGSADVAASDFNTPDETTPYRLSWHLGGANMVGGWRAGANLWLNDSSTWLRYVYHANTQPSYYPSGPQINVSPSTLTGWSLCYTGGYGDTYPLATLWSSCSGDYLLLAGGTNPIHKIDVKKGGDSVLNVPGGQQNTDGIAVGDVLALNLVEADGSTPVDWDDFRVFISNCDVGSCTPGDPLVSPSNWNPGTHVVGSYTIPAGASNKYLAFVMADDETFAGVSGDLITLEVERMPEEHLVNNCSQLQDVDNDEETYADTIKLTADINCQGVEFEPLNWSGESFGGTFDGQGHSISNLVIDEPNQEYVGLFVGLEGATLKNVALTSGSVRGEAAVGSLAGYANDTTIENAGSNLAVTAEDGAAGGLIGVVGDEVSISRSYALGAVSASDEAGGLVGYSEEDLSITNAYARGNVQGEQAGGLVGWVDDLTAEYAYYSGLLSAEDNAGGLLGGVDGEAELVDSFWDLRGSVNPTTTAGELSGASAGKTTQQMKALATFTQTPGLDEPWDFDDTWEINPANNGGYPYFAWQELSSVADLDNDGVTNQVEGAAPNSGDANNDNISDTEQANVTSLIDPVTGDYAVLVVDEECTITEISIAAESVNQKSDSGYQYPAGLMDFSLDCGTPGFTASITQLYYGVESEGFLVRKYNPSTHIYSTITNASVAQQTIGGQTLIQASYQVVDGGGLDTDGTANGTIEDPAGLAQAASLTEKFMALASTGANRTMLQIAGYAMGGVGALYIAYRLRLSRKTIMLKTR